jgi:hypothetical protein
VVETVESPKKKKARTGRTDSNRACSMRANVQDKEGTAVATTSLKKFFIFHFFYLIASKLDEKLVAKETKM